MKKGVLVYIGIFAALIVFVLAVKGCQKQTCHDLGGEFSNVAGGKGAICLKDGKIIKSW